MIRSLHMIHDMVIHTGWQLNEPSCTYMIWSVDIIINLKVQGRGDLGVSRRALAQDGLSGTVGLQQGKGICLYICILAFLYFFKMYCFLYRHIF